MRRVARDGAAIAAVGLLAGGLAAAAIVALGLGVGARAWYGFDLGRPVRLSAADLLSANARVTLLAFAGAAAISWWPRSRPLFDGLLVIVLALNAGLVGAALGAYGGPLLARVGAHSALELAAAAAAGAAYLHARRHRHLHPAPIAACAATAISLLAVGAVLEAHGH